MENIANNGNGKLCVEPIRHRECVQSSAFSYISKRKWAQPDGATWRRQGTAMLLVLMITSILLLGTYSLWRVSALAWEAALDAEKIQKRYYLVHGLALSGLAQIKSKIIDLSSLPDGVAMLVCQTGEQQLWLRYAPQEQIVRIQAVLYNSLKLSPIASWTLVCQIKPNEQIMIVECGNNLQI